jgi:hypothetical protein
MKKLFLIPITSVLIGCAPTVIYKSNPPGAIISGPAHGGGSYSYRTPHTLQYPSLASSFKEGICTTIETPTVRWDDGATLAPYNVCLVHRSSELTLMKPAPQPTYSQIIQSQPPLKDSLEDGIKDAKAKCLDLGFKPGTETFGKCVLRISK